MGRKLTPQEKADRAKTEDEWLADVIGLAKTFAWRTAHFRALRTEHGWRTPVQGDGKGFPDLILTRPPRMIVAELKRELRKLDDPHQQVWLAHFRGIAGVEVYVWRPSDVEYVTQVLSGRPLRPRKGGDRG